MFCREVLWNLIKCSIPHQTFNLYICWLVSAWTIQWFIILYNHDLSCCSNYPGFCSWELPKLVSVSFDVSSAFRDHINTVWCYTMSQDYLHFFCPISGASAGILLSGEGIWLPRSRCLIRVLLPRCHCSQTLSMDRAREYMLAIYIHF